MIGNRQSINNYLAQVDLKIVELLECASNDFLSLNEDFKQLYKFATTISENAEHIFKLLTDDELNSAIEILDKHFIDISKAYLTFNRNVEHNIKVIKGNIALISNIKFHSKNINQNLLTIKFLIANLKLSQLKTTLDVKEITDTLRLFNSIVNRLKIFELDFGNLLNEAQRKQRVAVGQLNKYLSELSQNFNFALERLHLLIISHSEKQQEIKRRLPVLRENSESISESTSKIITNLQYHDIIRQKIEHVQVSHKEILNSIENIDIGDDSTIKEYHSKLRNMANIQSALLVRANKEYQKAIEEITQMFRDSNNRTREIVSLYTDLIRIQGDESTSSVTNLSDDFNGLIIPLKSTAILSDKTKREFVTLFDLTNDLLNSIDCDEKQKLYDDLFNTTQRLNDFLISFEGERAIIGQIQDVSRDLEKSVQYLQTLAFELKQNQRNLINTEVDVSFDLKSSVNEIVDGIASIMEKLLATEEEENQLLETNLALSHGMMKVSTSSSSRIKYYDLFEKRIIEVIQILNNIFREVSGESEFVADEAELEFMKRFYTMNSEHEIHDNLLNNEEVDNDTKGNVDDESISDVEFF